ncbi:helix-turn-helix domain-containing protein [Cellvibrio sp. PSBB023]|uniref:helix-turn-helix domain-containing protein n=1 Tax=Cellvibrio sp. PSBB023 TaxID=1945512 RepID=UPI001AEF7D94|nr:helix-turn-helix transcriptional regulator [Cellvibrio sp. PSBB023]
MSIKLLTVVGWCELNIVRISALCQHLFGADIRMIGNRLKEERERLGYTQPVFAELAGAKKRTLIDWEKGVSSPTAVQLSALAEVGIDVVYVITGYRSAQAAQADPLTNRERHLLDNYRHSKEEDKAAIERVALNAAAAEQGGLTNGKKAASG